EPDPPAPLHRARPQAAAVLDEAHRQGEADGADAARDLLVRARRKARARTLAARRESYAELRREVTARVRALRRTDGYADLLERLDHRARALLGPDAEVTEHPEGGVVARAPGKGADLSLPALAGRALDRLGGEVRTLWET
ncbi:hypothetical protein ACWC8S_27860, partial [Streptomyces fungicidicus]